MTVRIDTLLRAALLAGCALFGAAGAGAAADPYQQMRLHWQARLIGDATTAADTEAGAAFARAAQRHLAGMSLDPAASALWQDAGDWRQANGVTASAVITTNYTRLEAMALAYAHPASPLHGDARLRAAILHGLDWMDRHHYRAGMQAYGNWWDWQIGTPLRLVNILTLVYADLPPELLARCLAAIDQFDPDPTRRTLRDGRPGPEIETGANRLDKALAVGLRGVLGRSTRHIAAGRDAVAQTLVPVTQGDGFHADGSFVQHSHVAYTGSYGQVALEDYARLVYLHAGSRWPLPAATLDGILHWAREAYVPWLFDGAMADAVRGRRISSEKQDDHFAGRRILAALAALAQAAPAGQADDLKAFVKGELRRDQALAAGRPDAGFGSHDLDLLRRLAADPSVAAADAPAGARVYAGMDRALMHGTGVGRGFGFVVSMYSDRISAFEYGNGEHARGWWNGIGMTSLYNADQAQYGGGYWPTVDAWRLPGTTTDHSGSGLPPAWAMFGNRGGWAGGAQLDGYAAVALKFDMRDVTGSDLHGQKSWFLLGGRIVASGSAIGAGGDVETIVDNRKVAAPDAGVLTVDGVDGVAGAQAREGAAAGMRVTRARASWAHLDPGVPGAAIGYVFPDHGPLTLLRETRSGSWRDINAMESPAPVANSFLSLAIPHGARPHDARYVYVLLPGADAAATAAYAARPTIAVLENSAAASAVRDAALGVTAANFWQGAVVCIDGRPWLASDSPASVVVHEDAGRIALAVAEPTQQRQADIVIELQRPASAVLHADPRIAVLSLNPVLRLRIHAAGSAGQSLSASFAALP